MHLVPLAVVHYSLMVHGSLNSGPLTGHLWTLTSRNCMVSVLLAVALWGPFLWQDNTFFSTPTTRRLSRWCRALPHRTLCFVIRYAACIFIQGTFGSPYTHTANYQSLPNRPYMYVDMIAIHVQTERCHALMLTSEYLTPRGIYTCIYMYAIAFSVGLNDLEVN